jgi:FkbM family methyltransferase
MFRSAKDLVRSLLRGVGYDIVSYAPAFHSLSRRRQFLDASGIDMVLDVGANIGQYASQLREIGYDRKIVSFEPVAAAFEKLRACAATDSQWSVHHMALGDTSRKQAINVSRNLQSSSLLPMLDSHLAAVPDSQVERVEEIVVKRLDEIIDEVAPEARRVFLKMDTQGFERAVVDGAAGCLSRIEAMQAEISLVPLYSGESDLCGFIMHMRSLGYEVAAIEPGFADGTTGRMLQVDCVFARTA